MRSLSSILWLPAHTAVQGRETNGKPRDATVYPFRRVKRGGTPLAGG